MAAFGRLLKLVGYAVFAISGAWGFFACLFIVNKAAGFWGLVVALLITPVTFLAAPLYAGFAWRDWFPLILIYGGGICAVLLRRLGTALDADEGERPR